MSKLLKHKINGRRRKVNEIKSNRMEHHHNSSSAKERTKIWFSFLFIFAFWVIRSSREHLYDHSDFSSPCFRDRVLAAPMGETRVTQFYGRPVVKISFDIQKISRSAIAQEIFLKIPLKCGHPSSKRIVFAQRKARAAKKRKTTANTWFTKSIVQRDGKVGTIYLPKPRPVLPASTPDCEGGDFKYLIRNFPAVNTRKRQVKVPSGRLRCVIGQHQRTAWQKSRKANFKLLIWTHELNRQIIPI